MAYLDSFQNADAQRRRELERKLHQDMEDLELLQESLTKTNMLTGKIESMLNSFDARLGKLETSILPIHRSTQKLTKLHDQINGSLQQVQTVVDYFDIATKEEPFVAKGPQEDDLTPFLKSVESLKDALAYLQKTKYKASDRAINHLKYSLTKALSQLNNLFRKWLTAASTPVDFSKFATTDLPSIPDDRFRNLQRLAQELQTTSIGDMEVPQMHLKTYEQTRSGYLTKSLQGLAQAAKEQEQKGLQTKIAYQKGSSALLPYARCLLKALKAERDLANKLLPKSNAPASFQTTIAPCVDAFTETGEALYTRVKRNVGKREYNDMFMLIDIVEGLIDGMKEFEGVITYAGATGDKLNQLVSNYKGAVVQALSQFYDDVKTEAAKGTPMSPDGTVHELTSTTMNALRRLVEYHKAVDRIIADGSNPMGARDFHTLATDILTALSLTIDQKAKNYKKPNLAAIFIMNNYYYIWKNVRSGDLSDILESDEKTRLEKGWGKGREGYRDSWKPVIEAITDKGPPLPLGTKNLSKSQKEVIKDQFKNFNNELEEALKAQKAFAVPDLDLRTQLIKDIKAIMLPFYKMFYEKHIGLDFTKNVEKYVKYSPKTLEEALEHLFDAGA